jgi:hypothetical protein
MHACLESPLIFARCMHAACMSLSPLAWYSMVNNVAGCRLQDGQFIMQNGQLIIQISCCGGPRYFECSLWT